MTLNAEIRAFRRAHPRSSVEHTAERFGVMPYRVREAMRAEAGELYRRNLAEVAISAARARGYVRAQDLVLLGAPRDRARYALEKLAASGVLEKAAIGIYRSKREERAA